jgi:hypothetical protein
MLLSIYLLFSVTGRKLKSSFGVEGFFFLAFFLAWGLWSAPHTTSDYLNTLVESFRRIYMLGLQGIISIPSQGVAQAGYPLVELYYTRITRYLPLFLSFLGLYKSVRMGKYKHFLLMSGVMFGSFYILPLWIGAMGWQFWDRTLFFAAIPVSALAASLYYKVQTKHSREKPRFNRFCSQVYGNKSLFLIALALLALLLPFKFIQYFGESTMFYGDSEVASGEFLGTFGERNSLLLTDPSFLYVPKFFDSTIRIDYDSYRVFFSAKLTINSSARYLLIGAKAEGRMALAWGEHFNYSAALYKLSDMPGYNIIYTSGICSIFVKR